MHVSSSIFELVHVDLWGPFFVPIAEGFIFFLSVVDDFSKCTWVYLLKTKSKTQVII